MKLMLAALVATSAIAIVASVFAIWPVVADAPWEDDGGARDALVATEAEAAVLQNLRNDFDDADLRVWSYCEAQERTAADDGWTVWCGLRNARSGVTIEQFRAYHIFDSGLIMRITAPIWP